MARTRILANIKKAMQQALFGKKMEWSESQLREQIEHEKFVRSRRDFVKHSATVAALTPIMTKFPLDSFRAPSSLPVSKTDPVLILGAGAAGLAAAYTLKKAGIPYKILEATLRTGGRVNTQFNFSSEGHFIERGAELVDSSHDTLIGLAREVGLEIEDFGVADSGLESEIYFFGGKVRTHAELVQSVGPLVDGLIDAQNKGARLVSFREAKQDPKALFWDKMSIADFMKSMRGKVEDWVIDGVGVAYLGEMGRELEEQSALNLIGEIDIDLSNGFTMFGESDESKRVKDGNMRLPMKLAEIVMDGNPDAFELGAKVVRIRDAGSKIVVTAKSGGKTIDFAASQVICTIPFSVLREVEGIEHLQLQPEKLLAIQTLGYGQNSKTMIEFSSRPWRERGKLAPASNGLAYTDTQSQTFWETSRLQSGAHGILTNFRGGHAGLIASRDTVKDSLADIAKLHDGLPGLFVKAVVMNWNQIPTIKGSYTCLMPGQYTRFNGVQGEAELNGRLLFAGEHCSEESQGFMNGAYETGVAAANDVIKSRSLLIPLPPGKTKAG